MLVDIHDPICLRVCIDLRKWELVIIREVNAFTRLLYKEGLIDPLLHNQLPILSIRVWVRLGASLGASPDSSTKLLKGETSC